MRRLRARARFFATAALSAFLAAAFYAFVYAPQRAALLEAETEALALRRDMARVEAFLRAHERGPEERAALTERMDRARAMLPETLETARFAAETARYAAEAGLALEGVAPEAAEAPRPPDGADASFTGGVFVREGRRPRASAASDFGAGRLLRAARFSFSAGAGRAFRARRGRAGARGRSGRFSGDAGGLDLRAPFLMFARIGRRECTALYVTCGGSYAAGALDGERIADGRGIKRK